MDKKLRQLQSFNSIYLYSKALDILFINVWNNLISIY